MAKIRIGLSTVFMLAIVAIVFLFSTGALSGIIISDIPWVVWAVIVFLIVLYITRKR